jgi:hypothetical protein
MSVLIQGSQIRQIGLGTRVERATSGLPASTTAALFTVAGGKVLITSIVGTVTTAVQAQATTYKLRATPTVGAVNDLSGTVDLNAAAAGALIGITGLAGDAAVLSTGGGVSNLRNPIVVNTGTIGATTVATSTGAIQWTLTYVPVDDGASVVAA